MRRIVGIAAAWLAATLVAVLIAAAAVGSVRSEVVDAPTALATLAIPASVTTTTPVLEESTITPTSFEPEETTTTTSSATDVVDTTTTATYADASTGSTVTTTSTAAPPEVTTTTAGYTKTYDTDAGSVRILVSGESVTFAGATPQPGWTVELKEGGPEEVKVHFERNEDEEEEIEFKAKFEDGELKVTISTE